MGCAVPFSLSITISVSLTKASIACQKSSSNLFTIYIPLFAFTTLATTSHRALAIPYSNLNPNADAFSFIAFAASR